MSSNVLAWTTRTFITTPAKFVSGAVSSTAGKIASRIPSRQEVVETFRKKIWHKPTTQLRDAAEALVHLHPILNQYITGILSREAAKAQLALPLEDIRHACAVLRALHFDIRSRPNQYGYSVEEREILDNTYLLLTALQNGDGAPSPDEWKRIQEIYNDALVLTQSYTEGRTAFIKRKAWNIGYHPLNYRPEYRPLLQQCHKWTSVLRNHLSEDRDARRREATYFLMQHIKHTVDELLTLYTQTIGKAAFDAAKVVPLLKLQTELTSPHADLVPIPILDEALVFLTTWARGGLFQQYLSTPLRKSIDPELQQLLDCTKDLQNGSSDIRPCKEALRTLLFLDEMAPEWLEITHANRKALEKAHTFFTQLAEAADPISEKGLADSKEHALLIQEMLDPSARRQSGKLKLYSSSPLTSTAQKLYRSATYSPPQEIATAALAIKRLEIARHNPEVGAASLLQIAEESASAVTQFIVWNRDHGQMTAYERYQLQEYVEELSRVIRSGEIDQIRVSDGDQQPFTALTSRLKVVEEALIKWEKATLLRTKASLPYNAPPLATLQQAADTTETLLTTCTGGPSSPEKWMADQDAAVHAWEELYQNIQWNLLPLNERESKELQEQLERACRIVDLPENGAGTLARQTHLAHALRPLNRTLQTLAVQHTDRALVLPKRPYMDSSTPCPPEFRMLAARMRELKCALQEGDVRHILHATRLIYALLTAILQQDGNMHPQALAACYKVPVEFIEQLYPLQQYLLHAIQNRRAGSCDPRSKRFYFRSLQPRGPVIESVESTLGALSHWQQSDDDRLRGGRALSRLVKGEKEERILLSERLLQNIWKHYIRSLDREEEHTFYQQRASHLEILLSSPHASINAPLILARQNAHRALKNAATEEIPRLLGTLEFQEHEQEEIDLPKTATGLPERALTWGSEKLVSWMPTGTVRAIAEPLIRQGASSLHRSLVESAPSTPTPTQISHISSIQIAPHIPCPPEFRILSKYVDDLVAAIAEKHPEKIRESTLQSWAALQAILKLSGAPDQKSIARFYGIPLPVVEHLMRLNRHLFEVLNSPDIYPSLELLGITQKTLALWQEKADLPKQAKRALVHAIAGERPKTFLLSPPLLAEYQRGYHHFKPDAQPQEAAPTSPPPLTGFVGSLLHHGITAIAPSSGRVRNVIGNQAARLHDTVQRTLEKAIVGSDDTLPPPPSSPPPPPAQPSASAAFPQVPPPEGERGITGQIWALLKQGLEFFNQAKEKGVMQIPKIAIQGAASHMATLLHSYIESLDPAHDAAKIAQLRLVEQALASSQEDGGIEQIGQVISRAITYFVSGEDSPTISDPFFMDNLGLITEALDFNVRQANNAQPLDAMMEIEKALFVKNTSHLTPLKFINEGFCGLPPPDFEFYVEMMLHAQAAGPSEEAALLKVLFMEHLENQGVSWFKRCLVNWVIYPLVLSMGRSILQNTLDHSVEWIREFIKKNNRDTSTQYANRLVRRTAGYLSILQSAFERISKESTITGTLEEEVNKQLDISEVNGKLTRKELYNQVAIKAIDAFILPPYEWTNGVHKALTDPPSSSQFLQFFFGALSWTCSPFVWIAQKISHFIVSSVAKYFFAGDIVETIVSQSLNAMQVNGYTHALNCTIYEQLQDVLAMLQRQYGGVRTGEEDNEEEPQVDLKNMSIVERENLRSLVQEVFGILPKSECHSPSELKTLMGNKSLWTQLRDGVNENFIYAQVTEGAMELIGAAFHTLLQKGCMESQLYNFMKLANSTYERNSPIPPEDFRAKEEGITRLLDNIINLAVANSITDTMDFEGTQAFRVAEGFTTEMQKITETLVEDLQKIEEDSLADLIEMLRIQKEALRKLYELRKRVEVSSELSKAKPHILKLCQTLNEQLTQVVQPIAQLQKSKAHNEFAKKMAAPIQKIQDSFTRLLGRFCTNSVIFRWADNLAHIRRLQASLKEVSTQPALSGPCGQLQAILQQVEQLSLLTQKRAHVLQRLGPFKTHSEPSNETKKQVYALIKEFPLPQEERQRARLLQMIGDIEQTTRTRREEAQPGLWMELLSALDEALQETTLLSQNALIKVLDKTGAPLEAMHALAYPEEEAGVAYREVQTNLAALQAWLNEGHIQPPAPQASSIPCKDFIAKHATKVVFNAIKQKVDALIKFIRKPYNWRYGIFHHNLFLPFLGKK